MKVESKECDIEVRKRLMRVATYNDRCREGNSFLTAGRRKERKKIEIEKEGEQ